MEYFLGALGTAIILGFIALYNRMNNISDACAKKNEVIGETKEKSKHNEETLGKHDTRIENNQKEISSLNVDLAKISGGYSPHQIVKSDSPIGLTEKGNKIAEKYELEKYAKKYADRLNLEGVKEEYKIQEQCEIFAFNKLKDELTEEDAKSFRKWAYEEGVDINAINFIIALLLRDIKLAEAELPVPEHSSST